MSSFSSNVHVHITHVYLHQTGGLMVSLEVLVSFEIVLSLEIPFFNIFIQLDVGHTVIVYGLMEKVMQDIRSYSL